MKSVGFVFWGIACRVTTDSTDDAERIAHAFRTFTGEPDAPLHCVDLATVPLGVGFFASLADTSIEKVVRTKAPGGCWREYERYRDRSRRLSPIPPFHSDEFRGRFALLHGAAVVPPTGEAVTLLGRSLAGKSTLTLELLRRGWAFASDDLVVVDCPRWRVRRFDRPIGIRERTREHAAWLDSLPTLPSAPSVATALGATVTVHADDLFGREELVRDDAPIGPAFVLDGYGGRRPAATPLVGDSWLKEVLVTAPDGRREALRDALAARLLSFDIDDPGPAADWLDAAVAAT